MNGWIKDLYKCAVGWGIRADELDVLLANSPTPLIIGTSMFKKNDSVQLLINRKERE